MSRVNKVIEESDNGQLAVQEQETTPIGVLPEATTTLTKAEQQDLERLEAQVKSAVFEAAKALWEINSRRLYRERYATFEKYCENTFNFSSRYIYYQVRFGQFLKTLEQSERAVHILPQSEYQARPLSKLKEESEQIEAWLEAVEKSEGKTPPYSLVEQVVRKKLTPSEKTPKLKPSLSAKCFCQLGGYIAQVMSSTDGGYQVRRWDSSETIVAIDDVRELQVDKRFLSQVQSYFDRLEVAAALVERYQEKTAAAVLEILAKAELPPTELETKLLKCLERELSRRVKAIRPD